MYSKDEPLFSFGHGLTYTSFAWSDLKAGSKTAGAGDTLGVSLKLSNTGVFDSDEVVQLYVSFPESEVDRPAIALKGFRRVHVTKGETLEVTIPVVVNDLAYWDTDRHEFVVEKGKVIIHAGASSADLRLQREVQVR